eukprot:CAMPEP_0181490666 /NCGR_PEP_ID=MMETSP1110-20121109/49686_1 /TAXON_ID=174948 /ORGANISM="Symbiodinium sp., Strain CCMP421" /LENGTH=61 /DNA_ID=CAMNT_0023617679 /DNA_START=570 /DNA_END=755 /DNA_ORIENTATION=-
MPMNSTRMPRKFVKSSTCGAHPCSSLSDPKSEPRRKQLAKASANRDDEYPPSQQTPYSVIL